MTCGRVLPVRVAPPASHSTRTSVPLPIRVPIEPPMPLGRLLHGVGDGLVET
jgi:hypothetical protein